MMMKDKALGKKSNKMPPSSHFFFNFCYKLLKFKDLHFGYLTFVGFLDESQQAT